MLAINLKIFGVVFGTIVLYTLLANAIPQVESEVPEELTLGAEFTTEELVAAGEDLYFGAGGCTACHGLGTRAPNLLEGEPGIGAIGARCGDRAPGLPCKEYLHQSLVDPNAYVVEGFQPIMPDMSRTFSPAQVWAVVAFLQSQEGEVTVTPSDVQAAAEAAGQEPGQTIVQPAAAATASLEPAELLQANQCLACHQLGGQGGPIGPAFDGLGASRTADHIRRSILEPNAEITAGYEAMAGTMPTTFGQQLTAAQLEAIVSFLAAQR